MKHHCEGFKGWFTGDCPQPVMNLRSGELFTDPQAELLGQAIVVLVMVALVIAITFVAWSMAND